MDIVQVVLQKRFVVLLLGLMFVGYRLLLAPVFFLGTIFLQLHGLLLGPVFLGYRAVNGIKLPYYLARCRQHGYFEDYPLDGVLFCPRCSYDFDFDGDGMETEVV